MIEGDRKQIGLTEGGRSIVALLTDELGWFDEAQAAGRFALGYAIRAGVEPGQTATRVETRWSPDLFDPSDEIRSLLRAMFPDSTMPVRLIEYLIDEGLSGSRRASRSAIPTGALPGLIRAGRQGCCRRVG